MDETLGLLLAGTLTFVFGWNNSSILIGNQRGSGTLTGRESVVLGSLGMLLGVVAEGSKMHGSLEMTIAGAATDPMVTVTLVVSIVLTALLTLISIPVAFSNTIVGAFLGAAFASSVAVRGGDVGVIVLFWAVAPVATMAIAYAVYGAVRKATSGMSLLSVDSFNRAGVVVVSLALAYVLSANNIGLFYAAAFSSAGGQSAPASVSLGEAVALALVANVAMGIFGRGNVAGTVGDKMLKLSPQGVLAAFSGTIIMMWVATQLGIPVSITQCLIGGMFGAALTKRISIVNRRLSLEVVASWVAIPVGAFVLAAVLLPLFW